jgi:catechol 2,3-dioxygenase-like lactoylglutathione lyase family enzyme
VGPVVIVVSDLERAEMFYTEVLSFRTTAKREAHAETFDRLTGVFGTNVRVATLLLGSESIQLMEYRTPRGRPVPPDSRSNDQWFQHIAIVVSDMDAASARLLQFHVRQISTAPQTLPEWNLNAAGIKALYFRDPDGHPLELIYFPPRKGDPRWHQNQGKREDPFLGIDHTAIAVADTERSLRFYHDVLGFRVVGESLNYGAEQDHLNHVFGSKVRITSLRSSAGPGVEFLEYLVPRDGRQPPTDTKANDLWSSQTTVLAKEFSTAVEELSKQKVAFVSPEPQETAPLGEKGSKGVLIRDPDGHMILFQSTPNDRVIRREFPADGGRRFQRVIARMRALLNRTGLTRAVWTVVFTLSPVFAFAPQSPDSGVAASSARDDSEKDPTPALESKRILWIIPNYRTSPSLKDYKPLAPRDKFKIATEDSIDRGTLALAALFGGQAQLTNSERSFGQGGKGYVRYFATSYGDWAIGNFMTEALYPTLLHQDPRYFRRNVGSGWSRLGYAVAQILRTHSDSGSVQFNFSEIVGNSTAAAISSAYYPASRDAQSAATKLGIQLGVDAASNILKEFWPDLSRKFGRRHRLTKMGGEPSLYERRRTPPPE